MSLPPFAFCFRRLNLATLKENTKTGSAKQCRHRRGPCPANSKPTVPLASLAYTILPNRAYSKPKAPRFQDYRRTTGSVGATLTNRSKKRATKQSHGPRKVAGERVLGELLVRLVPHLPIVWQLPKHVGRKRWGVLVVQ
jgi:hypothetical protein